MEITFWGDKLFEGKSGETVPAGFTIRTQIARQVDEEKGRRFRKFGQITAYVMEVALIAFFVTTLVVSGDLVPVYGFFETL